jgi:acetolactate synthase-1/2/3 large subunit
VRQTVAQVVVECLKEKGVEYVFGLSGHSVFDITDALYGRPEIRFIPVNHELSAAYMAEAYAKGTRKLGVCLASSGAGATNLLTGVAQAFKESSPVLAIAADVAREYAGKGASSWHEIPQEEVFRPVTKMSATINHAGDAVEILDEVIRAATTGRKGPVYLGIPRDIQSQEIDLAPHAWRDGAQAAAPCDPALLKKAADELARAAAPTIVAGGGVYWSRAEEELRELAEWISAPFGTTPSHKGLISEEHALSLGVLGTGAFPFVNQMCLESDLILAVGTTFSEAVTLGYGNRVVRSGARIIQIDIDPGEIGKIYPVHLRIVGDAKEALRGIIAGLREVGAKKSGSSPRAEALAREKKTWRDEIASRGARSDGPINLWHLCHALHSIAGDDTLIVGGSGTGSRLVATDKIHHSGDFRAIGNALTTAIGLKLALPSKRIVSVSGDGSFMLEMQEIGTAVAQRLPLVLLVINNGAYGNMKRDQIKHWGGRVIGTDLHLPDLCAVARAFGAAAERVESPSDLQPAIRRGMAAGRPALLDVACPIEGIQS